MTRCSSDHRCPAGLVCSDVDGVCRLPGGAPDASADDAAPPDLPPPDLAVDVAADTVDAPAPAVDAAPGADAAPPVDAAHDPAPPADTGPDACVPAPECPAATGTRCRNENTLVICTNDRGCPTAVALSCQPGAPCQGVFPTAACVCQPIPECQDHVGSFCVDDVLVRCNVGKTGCLEKMMMIACPADQVCVPGPIDGGSCVRPREAGGGH